MRVPFLWVALGFSAGVVVEKYGKIPVLWPACVLGPGIILLWFLRGRRLFLPLFILCLGCAGYLWARLDAHVPADAIQNYVGPERITLRGVVDSLPEMKTRGKKNTVSLVLQARSISRQENGRWKFHKVSGCVQVFLLQASALSQVGDELRLYGTLSAPRTVLNPGEFDYGKFLAQKNIHAVFQTIGKKCVRITKAGNPLAPARLIAETRRYLATLIDKLYKPEESAILKALVLGLRSDVSPEVRNHFFRSGTIHLLAISGMNITMIAGSFYLLLIACGLGYRTTAAVTLLIVVVYTGLAGFGIPVQRAGYVAVLMFLGVLLGRTAPLLNAMWIAFFFLLLGNPKSLWNIGFQLSFLSVFSLILILPLLSRFNVWSLSLGSSLAVLAGTFPVVLYYFNTLSPVSVAANLVAIPVFDAALFTALFTLLFSGVPFLNDLCAAISSLFLRSGLEWVKLLAGWPWGYWFFVRPSLLQIGCYYGCLAGLLACRRWTFRWKRFGTAGFAACWFILTVSFFAHQDPRNFQLTVLSGGRNQIAHVRFANGAHWLINAGRSFPSDQGEWLVAPFLRWQGVRNLEGVLLTDFSKKHSGGLSAILRSFRVRHLLCPGSGGSIPLNFLKTFRSLSQKTKKIHAGDRVLMGNESLNVAAQGRSGMAVGVASGPWNILLISKADPGILERTYQAENSGEVHAVIFLPGRKVASRETHEWLMRLRPLLLVLPDADPELQADSASMDIPCLDLKQTGALTFRKKGDTLEIESFLRGRIGLYSYF